MASLSHEMAVFPFLIGVTECLLDQGRNRERLLLHMARLVVRPSQEYRETDKADANRGKEASFDERHSYLPYLKKTYTVGDVSFLTWIKS